MNWQIKRTPDPKHKGRLRHVSLDVNYVRTLPEKAPEPAVQEAVESEVMESEILASGESDLPTVDEILVSAGVRVEYGINDSQISHAEELDQKGNQEAGSAPEGTGREAGQANPEGKAPSRRKGGRKARAKGKDGDHAR